MSLRPASSANRNPELTAHPPSSAIPHKDLTALTGASGWLLESPYETAPSRDFYLVAGSAPVAQAPDRSLSRLKGLPSTTRAPDGEAK